MKAMIRVRLYMCVSMQEHIRRYIQFVYKCFLWLKKETYVEVYRGHKGIVYKKYKIRFKVMKDEMA